MLGYKTRRFIKKAYTGIFRLFNDKYEKSNVNVYRTFVHNIYQNQRLNLSTAVLKHKHLNGFIRNFELLPNLSHLRNVQIRTYCSNRPRSFPLLTSEPLVPFPSIFSPISNLFLTFLVIKPYLDRDFSLREFLNTSKEVVQIVSRKLACNDIESIQPMVTPSVYEQLEQNLPKFSLAERQELAIETDDIYLSAISSMDLINEDSGKKYLKVATLHHALRGYNDMTQNNNQSEGFSPFPQFGQSPGNPSPFSIQQFSFDERKTFAINYKFIREYDPNTGPGDWMINGINHFRPQQAFRFPFEKS